MKIKAIIVSALILCCISAVIMYTNAAQPKNESKMITEAIQSKNTPQLIKALISRMKEQLDVNDDDFPELIKEVENYAAECKEPASTAVLHSMVAEMYNQYYTMNRWKINQRTDLAGYVPEDIREWTSNLFTNKIKEELTASLQPAKLLQETPISKPYWRQEKTRLPYALHYMTFWRSVLLTSLLPQRYMKNLLPI